MIMEGMKLAERYEILHSLGGGGMAVVYKAKDLVIDRYVAIKVMNNSLIHDQDFVRRFIREAKAAGSLSHPNIVSVYDVGREGSIYYMVMEYVDGPSLIDLIKKEGPFPPEKAVKIASQICDGLSHAHRHGIIHRDIKPHNILVGSDQRYKLTDFGISHLPSAATVKTKTGYVMGSVHYFSPEQASGRKVDYSSDLYSLGIVIYEMLTKKVPFNGDSSISIALKHLHDPVPDPTTYNPDISESMRQVLMRALEKDPEKRYQTAVELKHALQQALEKPDAYMLPVDRPKKKKSTKFSPKKIGILSGVAVVGLFLLTFGIKMIGETKQEKKPDPPSSSPTVSQTPANESRPEWNHKWWKEIPKEEKTESKMFRDFEVKGADGEYEVTLKVNNDLKGRTFYYDIYVVDGFSSRSVLNGRSVTFHKDKDQDFTTVDFEVNIPKEAIMPISGEGIAKITIYSLDKKSENRKEKYTIDNLLQMWGTVPESEGEKKSD
ncbi:serine/threonine protein kinase [Thermoactinomyces vulgaris]|jgi:eukaryotic-like serine/threonine-protein kinase|nr:serine/threonine protein kinase [Thermoactinomyces vulgaris]QCV54399.1 serine/threonine protein kinase [Thermoactinomyces vulgaris]RMB01070.1 serine/threonine protein kinase [Thermoactinomyces vulgaris]